MSHTRDHDDFDVVEFGGGDDLESERARRLAAERFRQGLPLVVARTPEEVRRRQQIPVEEQQRIAARQLGIENELFGPKTPPVVPPVNPGGGGGGGGGGGDEFDDPHTRAFEQDVVNRLAQLRQPLPAPVDLSRFQDLLRIRRDQPETRFTPAAERRITELQADPFTVPEENAIRVRAFDLLTRQKASAKQAAIDQLMALGHAPTSGTIARRMRDIDMAYAPIEAAIRNELLFRSIDERQRRQREALELTGMLTDFLEARQLGAGGTLADIGLMLQNRDEARARELLSTGAILPQLLQDRLALAISALNATPAPIAAFPSVLSGLAQIGALGQQSGGGLGALGLLLAMTLGAGQNRPEPAPSFRFR